jgi:hypothetical protein
MKVLMWVSEAIREVKHFSPIRRFDLPYPKV